MLLLDVLDPTRYDALVTDWRAGTLSLDRLVADSIVTGPRCYLETIRSDDEALARFMKCMDAYYPRT